MKLLKLKDPITGQEHDTIFIIINKFIKWGYFIIYTKEIRYSADLYKRSIYKIWSTSKNYIKQRY